MRGLLSTVLVYVSCVFFCFNFLISLLNICCGYPENQSQSDGSFEQPKDMLNVMGRKKDNFT